MEHQGIDALLLPATNVYLTHFFGDWAKEMLSRSSSKSRPAQKFWIPKSVCAAINFASSSRDPCTVACFGVAWMVGVSGPRESCCVNNVFQRIRSD